jgi:hypothetical protein
LRIERSGAHDQPLRQRMVDAPVAQVEGVGQRRACRRRLHTHVEQLGSIGGQTRLDVAQRLAPSELRKGHDAEQVGTAQRAHARVALVPFDDAPEGLPRHELHHLREQRLPHVHASPRVRHPREHRKPAAHNPNRGHP